MNRENTPIFTIGPEERGMRESNNKTVQGSEIYWLAGAGLPQ
jgi:hypothetical protein